jgi:hypothetical protein
MSDSSQPTARGRLLRTLVTMLCLALVATVLWQLLPKAAFSSDLARVGQGKPALVMLREVHIMGGELVIEQMLQIHPEFESAVEFLVVHTGHPDGENFARVHGIRDGALVLFDAEGEVLGRIGRPDSAAGLRQFIVNQLGW